MHASPLQLINDKPTISPLPYSPTTDSSELKPKKFEKLLHLVGEAIDLEFRFKASMQKVDAEVKALGENELPMVLMSFVHRQRREAFGVTNSHEGAPEASTAITKRPNDPEPGYPSYPEGSFKQRIMLLMADGKQRKSGMIIKRLRGEKQKSSYYSALSELVTDGALIKTAYAHYKKR